MRDAAGKLGFHGLAPPTTDEVTEVAVRTAKRLQKVLAHGRLLEDVRIRPDPIARFGQTRSPVSVGPDH